MNFSMSINFNGNCKDAVCYYAKVFKQPIPKFIPYENQDTTFDTNFINDASMKNLIMFTSLNIAGTIIQFNDMPPQFEFNAGNHMFLMIIDSNINQLSEIFTQLSIDGEIAVAFNQISENQYYGMVVDKFGLGWIIQSN